MAAQPSDTSFVVKDARILSRSNRRMTPRQIEGSKVRWVYLDRYEVHTHTKEQAIQVFRQFGFVNVDESKVVRGRSIAFRPVSTDFERGAK